MKLAMSLSAGDGGKSGIGRYFIEMLTRMAERLGDRDQLLLFVPEQDQIALIPHAVKDTLGERLEIITLTGFWQRTLGNLLWHFIVLPGLAKKQGVDVMLFPAANRRCASLPGIATVGVVHDLSQLHIKGKYDAFRTWYVLKLLPAIIRRLDKVVTVSHSTARDVASYIGIPQHKIQVIHNGVDADVFSNQHRLLAKARVNRNLGISSPYLLYTARLEHPGKNHINLLEAVANIKSKGRLQHKLVLAGGRWNGAEVIEAKVKELGLDQDVIFTGFVPQEDLPALVAAADVFVFPSLFEGFGIPIVEAFAAGTPVCASNVASIPEVTGDAALLFNPEDIDSLTATLLELLDMPEWREILVRRGHHRLQSFDWDQAAAALLQSCRRTALLARKSEAALRQPVGLQF